MANTNWVFIVYIQIEFAKCCTLCKKKVGMDSNLITALKRWDNINWWLYHPPSGYANVFLCHHILYFWRAKKISFATCEKRCPRIQKQTLRTFSWFHHIYKRWHSFIADKQWAERDMFEASPEAENISVQLGWRWRCRNWFTIITFSLPLWFSNVRIHLRSGNGVCLVKIINLLNTSK